MAREVDLEIATHIELRTDEFMRRGLSRDAARAAALRRFDSIGGARNALYQNAVSRERRMHTRELLADAWNDLSRAVRTLNREAGFSGFVILTLALGIGVNAAMFGVVDRLLVRGPEHVRDAGHVRRVQIATRRPGQPERRSGSFPYAAYLALRDNSRSFQSVAAYSISENGVILGRGAQARQINRGEATADLFPLLGVRPALGRFFDKREDDTGDPLPVVVIGHGLWQSEFGGQSDAIGQQIVLDDANYTIVGVAPAGFTGPDLTRVDVWFPESLLGRRVTSGDWTARWNSWWLSLVVRLEPGVSREQADADATLTFRNAYAGRDSSVMRASLAVKPLQFTRDGERSGEARVSLWLLIVGICVLLIAGANVINLFLARAIRRQREFAVRVTLGAGRARLVRLMMVETLLLAGGGALVGVAVAASMGRVLRERLLPSVEWTSGVSDGRVVIVATLLALVTGAIVGLVPAVRASAPDLTPALKAGVREGGGRTGRLRAALIMTQAALSVLLLVGAGLFLQSLSRVRALDLGLDPARVLTFSVRHTSPGAITDTVARRQERERRAGFYVTALEEIRRRPDVERASLAIGLSFSSGFGDEIRVPGRDSIPVLPGGGPFLAAVTPDYFTTVGTRIVRGRSFNGGDRRGSEPVAIVNETMAATLWPNESPLGKCFHVGSSDQCARIVGVAEDTRRFRLREDRAMFFYLPFGQEESIGGTQLLVRPRGNADQVLAEVRRQLTAFDPGIVFVYGNVLQNRVDPQIRPWRLGATVFSLMGVLALLVAAIGLYSVMSHLVSHRRQEIGIRLALGAHSRDVLTMIVRNGVGLTAAGLGVGLLLAFATARFVEPLLFDTSPRDPLVYATVAVTLLVAATLASLVPGSRATRVDPVEAMRAE